MDSCKWKGNCRMTGLARARTRPPWRPAASSMTANMDMDVPPRQFRSRKSQKSTELTIPPQYMKATDLIAALPKRQRMPKQQNNALAAEPRVYPRTPWAPFYEPLRAQLEAADFGKRSSEHTPKSEHARPIASDARPRSNTGKHGSPQPTSPPSSARSPMNSGAQSERSFAIASPRVKKPQSSEFLMSQPTSPSRNNGPAYDRASPASEARSPDRHSRQLPASAHSSRHRTRPATNSGRVSANDPMSSRFDITSPMNLPSRGTTGGSARSISTCSSVLNHRSRAGPPASGRCSPPTPPSPSRPSYSPY